MLVLSHSNVRFTLFKYYLFGCGGVYYKSKQIRCMEQMVSF